MTKQNGNNASNANIPVKVRKLRADATLPTYGSSGAAAFDLYAAQDVIIEPGAVEKIPLGLAFDIPAGYAMFIVPRSGISLRTKLRQPNGIGVIDSDYRGEVAMLFENTWPVNPLQETAIPKSVSGDFIYGNGEYPLGTYIIRKGDRIAQGVLQRVSAAEFIEVDALDETARGAGGFGSSGVSR
ncbi:dUTP diphosphatase [Salibacterium aidingense]|uniref:dUTP diphosphatase n=1 Tax=Salibacterium aidingense TaxID=384933 RepID=UPI003BBF4089